MSLNVPSRAKVIGSYVNPAFSKTEAALNGLRRGHHARHQRLRVAECTGENLFMVRNGRIVTPPFGSSILGGITRDTLITIARDLGVVVEERMFTRDELYVADEVFLCGTAADLGGRLDRSPAGRRRRYRAGHARRHGHLLRCREGPSRGLSRLGHPGLPVS